MVEATALLSTEECSGKLVRALQRRSGGHSHAGEKMLTQKRIFGCVRPLDWFAAIDLKDTYFYVSILLQHRPFLRFAFEGRAYQYKVLPFGLSLSARFFTKVVEVALVPLREWGVRILNYLDDWLILAQSPEQLCTHRDLVLRHLSQLGLRINWEHVRTDSCLEKQFLGRGDSIPRRSS